MNLSAAYQSLLKVTNWGASLAHNSGRRRLHEKWRLRRKETGAQRADEAYITAQGSRPDTASGYVAEESGQTSNLDLAI
jgi:hypothetical protein